MYDKYSNNGIMKPLRRKMEMKFQSFEETMVKGTEPAHDMLPYFGYQDAEKPGEVDVAHITFMALDAFRAKHKRLPEAWNVKDALALLAEAKEIEASWKNDKFDDIKRDLKTFFKYAFTLQGTFNPLGAFFGGYVCQEIVKAITNKFVPLNQLFYYNATEVVPDFELTEDLLKNEAAFTEAVAKVAPKLLKDRTDGLRICVGQATIDTLKHSKLFMVGAGAIGCELLKNYAMLGVGTGQATKDKAAG